MLLEILLSVIGISLLSLIGVFTLSMNEDALKDKLLYFVAFAAGVLLGAAFLDLIPESIHLLGDNGIYAVLGGIVGFFIIERFVFWHHCHTHDHEIKSYTYLNLVGDAVHNFVDGAIIAAAYITDVGLGIITTVAIALHEIPQEIGDFAILVHGGFSTNKALLFNFLSAITAIVGALITFYLASAVEQLIPFLVGIAGGGFAYIAIADLLPELHEEEKFWPLFIQTCLLIVGILAIYYVTGLVPHSH